MKINTANKSYEEVMALPRLKHFNPMKPSRFLGTVVRLISIPTYLKTKFSYTTERMELVGKKPCLILMNHSSFIDLKIVSKIFYPKPYGIVCTSDGFIGKEWLMRFLILSPREAH